MKRLATVTLFLWCAARPVEALVQRGVDENVGDEVQEALDARVRAEATEGTLGTLLPASYSGVPDAGAIALIGGGARTFLCTFDKILENFVVPLDEPRGGADVYAFLKTSDPGPKHQRGYDFEYKDVDAAALREKLATYPNVVGSTIIPEPACQGSCLLDRHVRCRSRFQGFFGECEHLARYAAFAAGLEYLGTELFALEAVRGQRYAVVAWMRPDVFPRRPPLPNYAWLLNSTAPGSQYHSDFHQNCHGAKRRPTTGAGFRATLAWKPSEIRPRRSWLGDKGPWPDMARIFDRSSADLYLFEPLQILRDCNRRGSWGRSEDIWRAHTQCVNKGHCGGCLDAMPVRKCTISGPGELVFKCVATGCGASTAP